MPFKGARVSFQLASGGSINGILDAITNENMSVNVGSAVMSFRVDQIRSSDACVFFQNVYAGKRAQQQVEKEKLQYFKTAKQVREQDGRKYLEQLEAALLTMEDKLKKYHKELGIRQMLFKGKILQVLGNDSLAISDSGGSDGEGESLYIEGVGANVVDDSRWTGTIYFRGTKEYTTVLGAPKKVWRYSVFAPPDLAAVAKNVDTTEMNVRKLKEEIGKLKKELRLDPWMEGSAR